MTARASRRPGHPARAVRVILLLLVLLAALVVAAACATRSTGGAYLDELEAAGLLDGFESEGAAVEAGHETCRRLDSGDDPEGTEAQRIAVDHFCDEYLGMFEVVE